MGENYYIRESQKMSAIVNYSNPKKLKTCPHRRTQMWCWECTSAGKCIHGKCTDECPPCFNDLNEFSELKPVTKWNEDRQMMVTYYLKQR